jgi:phage gp45-like
VKIRSFTVHGRETFDVGAVGGDHDHGIDDVCSPHPSRQHAALPCGALVQWHCDASRQ